MEKCRVLNNLFVEEVYYPKDVAGATVDSTCDIIEGLATRVEREIFGTGRTFRGTEDCKKIVRQYLCLFWGSHNTMYKNWCRFIEKPISTTRTNSSWRLARRADPSVHRWQRYVPMTITSCSYVATSRVRPRSRSAKKTRPSCSRAIPDPWRPSGSATCLTRRTLTVKVSTLGPSRGLVHSCWHCLQ